MPANEEEEQALLLSVAIQNAKSILHARQQAEVELLNAKEALEKRTVELERALVDLHFQSELTRTIAENAASCLFMMDDRGCVTYLNPAATDVTGFVMQDFSGASFRDVLHASRESAGHASDECPIAKSRERLAPLRNHRDVFLRKRGEPFPVSCSVSPLQRDGSPAGAVLEFRDITDELRAQTTLEDANRRKDQFLATLSHELRTPMTAVLGWSRMLKMGLSDSETQQAIDAIEKSAAVQAQLIDDVLDVSRIMAGKMTFEPRPVDLSSIVQAAMTTVHPAAAARNIEILTSIPPQLPPVMGDEGRLQQVIWNLLANAVKFTPRGGNVTIRLTKIGSILRLAVQDSGKGIEPDFLPHVFEPFSQEDSSATRSHEGIGLGLSIVRSLVELHGGRVRASSEGAGHGATFTVDLPFAEGLSNRSARRESAQEGAVARPLAKLPELAGLSILVVDDQEFTRDLVTAILRRAHAKVQSATSVNEGLEAFHAEEANVVVCDIAMPEQDGYAFVRKVRELRSPRSRTPIIALTAFGRPEDRRLALTSGFDEYLKKPVDPVELAETVLRLSTTRH